MKLINSERVIDTLVELCELRSPSREEGPVREYLNDALRSLGLSPEEDTRGNVYVHVAGNAALEPLFLCAHMDTVPVPEGSSVTVVRGNGRISSDGTTILGGDDKQGIAAALEMIRLAVARRGDHRSLDVVFTVEEELGSLGSRDVDRRRLSAGQGYNLDGETAPGTAITRAPRKARYTVVVHGRSTHAALDPEGGINAIVIAARMIPALPSGAPDGHSTANIGVIHGGKQTNVVPDTATFIGEIRSFSEDSFMQLREQVDCVIAEVAFTAGATVTVTWEETYDRYDVAPDEPCIQWFVDGCQNAGLEPTLLSSRGGGDANQLNNMGLNCIVFGLGMHEIHSVNEYVIEEEYLTAVELLASIVFPVGTKDR